MEAMLSVSLFGLLVTALTGAWLYGEESTVLAGKRQQAAIFAEEGIEAVRNMRDESFANLSDGTHGLAISAGQWTFSGTQDVNGIFTRQIAISTVDATTKKITSSVNWTQNGQRTGLVSLDTQLTNWMAPTIKPKSSMLVYSKSTNVPYYRIWDGTNWGSENSATAVSTGADIQYVVLKFAPTRNEAILGTLDSLGDIRVQAWNGNSWGSTTLLSNIGTTNDAYRGFDVEYETNSGRALALYNNANSQDPSYRIWNGSSWSSETTLSAPPTTGVPRWIEMAANPISSSNEIAMLLLDANDDVYGMAWNGSSWVTMGTAAVWDATAASSARKAIDVAYEQNLGRAIFMWADATSTDQYYRIWNGSALTAATLLDIPAAGGIGNWIKLAPRPNSNEIMYGVQDAGADLNTRKWSGSAWDTATQHPEHDASLENAASMNFDLTYETFAGNEGRAWLMWGDGSRITSKAWSGSAWESATVMSNTNSDDTSNIILHTNPTTGAVFAGAYQSSTSATDDILEYHLIEGSSTWTSKFSVWGGPVSADPVMFRIDIATERNN